MKSRTMLWRMAALALCLGAPARAGSPFPERFDPIGTPVESIKTRAGRTVHFTDTGEPGWQPVLFIGGAGTSARAPELVGFLDTMRRNLKLRIIAVERNGLGDTTYDPGWTGRDYADEVDQVLDRLGVKHFAVVAISGGGAYAGRVVEAMPERVRSWHMAAAISALQASDPRCGASQEQIEAFLSGRVAAPRVWWDLPGNGVSARIRGFADRAADEGARTFFIAGQKGDPRGVAREYRLFCEPAAKVSAYRGPAFFYYGEADSQVPALHGQYWAGQLNGPVVFRSYPGEGHDVQYRHWDQLLLDIAGKGEQTLVCARGRNRLVRQARDARQKPLPGPLGLCAWQGT